MNSNIYGYWVAPDGSIIEVGYESHAEVAIEKVLKRPCKKFSVYAVMFRLGYMRVVNLDGVDCLCELWKRHTPNKVQKSFIKCACNVEYATRETYGNLYAGLL